MNIQLFKKLADVPSIERFNENLPVFASQEYSNYLKNTKNYSTIWFHGIVEPNIQFILPLAIRKMYAFKNGLILTSTIYLDNNIKIEIEREFLNGVMAIIRQKKLCDWIGQPKNWALFNVVPSNSIYCEFGSYRINLLENNTDELFAKMGHNHRQQIKKSIKDKIIIKSSHELLEDCSNVFMEAAAYGNHTLLKKKR